MVIVILYFCSMLIIYLQSGIPTLQWHIMIWIGAFLFIYGATIVVMIYYYVDKTGNDFFFGRVLDPPIQSGQETTFIICLAILGLVFLLLERFIKLYANTLLERSRTIEALEIEQEELRQEIKRFREEQENDVDLDAPIQKVIAILQNIGADNRTIY